MWSRFIDLQDRMEKAQVTTVREAMHDAMTCTPETLLVDATDAMLNERRHRICVVDEDDKVRSISHRSPYDRVGVVNAVP
jgi:CBS domain-containing protein